MAIKGVQVLLHYATDQRSLEIAGDEVTVCTVSAAVRPKLTIFFDVFEGHEDDDMIVVFSDTVPRQWYEPLALYLTERALRKRIGGPSTMPICLAANPDAVKTEDRKAYADFWRAYLDALEASLPGGGMLDRSLCEEIEQTREYLNRYTP